MESNQLIFESKQEGKVLWKREGVEKIWLECYRYNDEQKPVSECGWSLLVAPLLPSQAVLFQEMMHVKSVDDRWFYVITLKIILEVCIASCHKTRVVICWLHHYKDSKRKSA